MSTPPNPSAPSRRQFFRSAFGAAGGLVLGLSFERGLRAVRFWSIAIAGPSPSSESTGAWSMRPRKRSAPGSRRCLRWTPPRR